MLRLIINNTEADLYENAPVNLTFRYSDATSLNNAAASYSQTFRLPLTQQNRTIFGDIDEVGLQGGLDVKSRLTASLFNEGTPLLSGYIQIKGVYMTKEVYAEVEVAFFSSSLDLKSEVGNKLISDLDLTSRDHDLTYANVASTWSGVGTIYPGIRYGLIDKGQNYSFPDRPLATSSNPLYLSQLTPFIQAKVLLDTILDEAGFTYDSTYLNGTDFAKVYVPAYNGSAGIVPSDIVDNNVRATLPSNQTTTSTPTKVGFSDIQSGCFDAQGNWNNTNDEYTVPRAGLYTITFTFSYYNPLFPTTQGFYRVIYGSTTTSPFTLQTSGENISLTLTDKLLSSGDKIYVEIWHSGTAFDFISNGNYNTGLSTSLEVIESELLGGYEIGVAQNLPVMKQIDFLTSLQKMFNLVFVPDGNKPNHLSIETYVDYTSSGASRDWTTKIDYSKDVSLKPTTDIQKAEYNFTYSPNKDFISEEVQRSLDRVYGRQRILEQDNDFATGEQTIQPTFSSYIVSLVPGSTVPIHRSLTQDGQRVSDPVPMICYYGGLSSRIGTTIIVDETNTQRTQTSLAFFSMHDTDNPSVTDNDLAYGVERTLYSISVNPRDTLYIRFWAQYVKELYSSDSRIMRCHVRLNEADIARFKFNDRIYIKNQEYRVLSLTYDANEPSVAQAELLLILDDLALCGDTPTGLWATSNVILFNSSNPGAPDYGSQACCEFYGYSWDLNKTTGPRCRPKNQILTT